VVWEGRGESCPLSRSLTLVVLAVALGAMLPGYIHGWMVPASGWAYADNRPLGVLGRLAQLAGAVAGFWIVVRGMVIFQWIAGSLAVAFIAAWLGHWLVFG